MMLLNWTLFEFLGFFYCRLKFARFYIFVFIAFHIFDEIPLRIDMWCLGLIFPTPYLIVHIASELNWLFKAKLIFPTPYLSVSPCPLLKAFLIFIYIQSIMNTQQVCAVVFQCICLCTYYRALYNAMAIIVRSPQDCTIDSSNSFWAWSLHFDFSL